VRCRGSLVLAWRGSGAVGSSPGQPTAPVRRPPGSAACLPAGSAARPSGAATGRPSRVPRARTAPTPRGGSVNTSAVVSIHTLTMMSIPSAQRAHFIQIIGIPSLGLGTIREFRGSCHETTLVIQQPSEVHNSCFLVNSPPSHDTLMTQRMPLTASQSNDSSWPVSIATPLVGCRPG
jgi:hypothetical protein